MCCVLGLLCWAAGSLECAAAEERYVCNARDCTPQTLFSGVCWSGINGGFPAGGGAVYVNVLNGAPNIEFRFCGFSDIKMSGSGGAVYINAAGQVSFVSCEFSNIESRDSGGAVYIATGGPFVVRDTDFTDVRSGGFGGAFYAQLTQGAASVQVIDSSFVKCVCGVGWSRLQSGTICYCTLTTPGTQGTDLWKFESCEFREMSEKMASGVYCACTGNNQANMKIKNCTFNIVGLFEHGALDLQSNGPLIIEETIFNNMNGGFLYHSPSNPPAKVDIRDSRFNEATSEREGVVIDTQDIKTVNLDNVTFNGCKSSATVSTASGGVVLVRSSTTTCEVNECKFYGNNIESQTHALCLILVLPSSVVISGCTFSSHAGAVPVLKVEEASGTSKLLETYDFTLTNCHFEDNNLDANAGLIVFPGGAKTTQCKGCWFLNNQGTICTQWTQCAFEECRFRVSVSDQQLHTPVKQEPSDAQAEFTFLKCIFVHSGSLPDGAEGIFLSVAESTILNLTDCCFDTNEPTSISGGQQTLTNTNFSDSECIISPDDPPEPPIVIPTEGIESTQSDIGPDEEDSSELDPTRDDSSESPSKSPTGAIVGGVIGALAAVAVVVLLVYFLVLRKRIDTHEKLSASSGETAEI